MTFWGFRSHRDTQDNDPHPEHVGAPQTADRSRRTRRSCRMGGHPEQQRARAATGSPAVRTAGHQDIPDGRRPPWPPGPDDNDRGLRRRGDRAGGSRLREQRQFVVSGGTKAAGGTATYALPPSTTPNYIFPLTNSTYFSVANICVPAVLPVPPAVLVRQRHPAHPQPLPQPGRPAGVQRQAGHDHAEELQVVRRHGGHRAERAVLDQHDAGGRPRPSGAPSCPAGSRPT